MNVVIVFMLIFACVGIIDKILGNRFRLAEEFDKGVELMGSMALALAGITCVGVTLAQANAESISKFAEVLHFDPSVITGMLLAPDMGAFPISLQIAQTRGIAVFSGMILATSIGVTICFQLPICLSGIKGKENTDILMKGFIIGLAVCPPGLIIGALMLKLSIGEIIVNMLPVLIICALLIVGFIKSVELTGKILAALGNIIRIITLILFAIVILGIFVPSMSISDYSLAADVFVTVAKMMAVVCGALVLSKLALRLFKIQLQFVANALKTNEYAIIGLVLSLTTTFAMIPLFHKMDRRGKLINAAFSIGGAYLIGGQMAYVATQTNGWEIATFFVTKIILGVCAIVVACFFDRKISEKENLDLNLVK